eukprot:CAMPEP_0194530726 /NCGR_PEP_ID=MMETSP0253-20130528/67785_1 /TAXON_ID=2966 /ORGANISM="Noctiluca scintillans" /LENGTH=766 /DNA_ID=CAMNT_0039375995 /DNA_START=23 /DNA_END=2323 /DNA_ORIENTATION=+
MKKTADAAAGGAVSDDGLSEERSTQVRKMEMMIEQGLSKAMVGLRQQFRQQLHMERRDHSPSDLSNSLNASVGGRSSVGSRPAFDLGGLRDAVDRQNTRPGLGGNAETTTMSTTIVGDVPDPAPPVMETSPWINGGPVSEPLVPPSVPVVPSTLEDIQQQIRSQLLESSAGHKAKDSAQDSAQQRMEHEIQKLMQEHNRQPVMTNPRWDSTPSQLPNVQADVEERPNRKAVLPRSNQQFAGQPEPDERHNHELMLVEMRAAAQSAATTAAESVAGSLRREVLAQREKLSELEAELFRQKSASAEQTALFSESLQRLHSDAGEARMRNMPVNTYALGTDEIFQHLGGRLDDLTHEMRDSVKALREQLMSSMLGESPEMDEKHTAVVGRLEALEGDVRQSMASMTKLSEVLRLTQNIAEWSDKVMIRINSETATRKQSETQVNNRLTLLEKSVMGLHVPLSFSDADAGVMSLTHTQKEKPVLLSEDLKQSLESLAEKVSRTLKVEPALLALEQQRANGSGAGADLQYLVDKLNRTPPSESDAGSSRQQHVVAQNLSAASAVTPQNSTLPPTATVQPWTKMGSYVAASASVTAAPIIGGRANMDIGWSSSAGQTNIDTSVRSLGFSPMRLQARTASPIAARNHSAQEATMLPDTTSGLDNSIRGELLRPVFSREAQAVVPVQVELMKEIQPSSSSRLRSYSPMGRSRPEPRTRAIDVTGVPIPGGSNPGGAYGNSRPLVTIPGGGWASHSLAPSPVGMSAASSHAPTSF